MPSPAGSTQGEEKPLSQDSMLKVSNYIDKNAKETLHKITSFDSGDIQALQDFLHGNLFNNKELKEKTLKNKLTTIDFFFYVDAFKEIAKE